LHEACLIALPPTRYSLAGVFGYALAGSMPQHTRVDRRHLFTLIVATFPRLPPMPCGQQQYRLLKANHAGQYTFILEAPGIAAALLIQAKTIGLRVRIIPCARAAGGAG